MREIIGEPAVSHACRRQRKRSLIVHWFEHVKRAAGRPPTCGMRPPALNTPTRINSESVCFPHRRTHPVPEEDHGLINFKLNMTPLKKPMPPVLLPAGKPVRSAVRVI